MSKGPAHLLAKHLHALSTAAQADRLPDGELLRRFVAGCDEDAFAALVRRHGPMVLRVCRRILHDSHDAEDVFQATFLVLSRKAASLRRRDSVGCFLHGVAYRLALKARTQFAQQRLHENRAVVEKQAVDPLAELTVREAQAILDEELARLPEKHRTPLVLCCLEGKTRDEAARMLGWPAKLVKSRLEQGRERLRQRLSRRGLTPPAALVASLLAEEAAPATVPVVLIRTVVQAAPNSNGVSASVALLAESALGGTAIGKAKVGVLGLLVLTGVLAAGMGAFAPPQTAEKPAESPAVANAPEPPKTEKPQTARTDRYGDPLPPQALERLGTLRFRPGVWVWHLSFSPDGKLLAAATHNWQADSISLWDRATGKCLRLIDIGNKSPFTLAFTPDGKILAAQDHQGEIHLWEVESGKELRRFKGHVGFLGSWMGRIVLSVGFIFTPDGKALVARGPDKAIHLWELATGKELRKFQADPEDLSPLAFSRDGKLLATYNEKLIRLWDVQTGKEKTRLRGHETSVGSPVFSPNGKTLSVLAGKGWQGTAYVWDIAAAKLLHKWNLPVSASPYCISPDGATALAGGHYGDMRLIDLANGKEIRRCSCPLYPISAAAFSPDGKTIAAAGSNGAILFWDALSGQPEVTFLGHQGSIKSLALSPDDKFLASVAADDGIMLWDLATARPRPGFHSPKGGFNSVAISPDGQWLATGIQWRKDVRLLKTLTGEEVRRFAGCENGENVLAFSPDGKILAAGSTDNVDRPRDKSIRLWEAATGKLLRRIVFPLPDRPRGGIVCLAFSPDGRFLVSGGGDKAVHIWNAASGELYCQVPGHEDRISSLCFSPDGQTLAVTDWEQTKKAIHLWEVRSGKERGQLVGHTDRDSSLAFSPDPDSSLAFSPDGRLASGGDDKTICIRNLDTGEELGCFRGHESDVGPLAFSSDGRRLISGSRDTTILVWDMKTILQPRRIKAAELSPKELEARWTDLADADASKAFGAIRILIRARRQSVSFLKEHLRPVPPIAAVKIAARIAELDSEQFETRAKAEAELKELKELAEPSLRQAVRDKRTSLEQRRRIDGLLQRLEGPITSTETLRRLRAVEALEHIGSPEARQVLQTLTEGAPQALLTRQAKAALKRLTHQHSLNVERVD
jgi:RNA polymerase sigma factor (sigma-70 family)